MLKLFILLNLFHIINIVNSECISNSYLLKEKLQQKRHEHLKTPTNGIIVSLKLQEIDLILSKSKAVIDGYLTKQYHDSDLNYSENQTPCEEYAIVRMENITALKTPSVRLMNGKIISDAFTKTNAIVYPNGTVIKTQRIAIESSCVVDSISPTSALECRLIWQNLDYKQNDMFVIWSDDIKNNPSALSKGIQSKGDYKIKSLNFTHNIIQKSIGNFDELVLTIKMEKSRIKEFCLFYLPQLIFVSISWLSMFLGPMAITRSILIVGSMILLLIHQHFYLSTTVTLNNFNLYDVWKLSTLLFTFLTLIELILITCMASIGRSNKIISKFGKKNKNGKSYYSFEPIYEEMNDLRNRQTTKTCTCCSYSALFVDVLSLVLLGTVFFLFCIVYFGQPEQLIGLINDYHNNDNINPEVNLGYSNGYTDASTDDI